MFETLTRGLMRPDWGMDKLGTQLGYTLGGGYQVERDKRLEEERKKEAMKNALASAMAIGGAKNGRIQDAAAVASQMNVDPMKVAEAFNIGRNEYEAALKRTQAEQKQAQEKAILERLMARPEYAQYKDIGITDMGTFRAMLAEDRAAAQNTRLDEQAKRDKAKFDAEVAAAKSGTEEKAGLRAAIARRAEALKSQIAALPEDQRARLGAEYNAQLAEPTLLTVQSLDTISKAIASNGYSSLPISPEDIARLQEDPEFKYAHAAYINAPSPATRKVVMDAAGKAEKNLKQQAADNEPYREALSLVNQLAGVSTADDGTKGQIDGSGNYKSLYGSSLSKWDFDAITPDWQQSTKDAEAVRKRLIDVLGQVARKDMKGQGNISDSDAAAAKAAMTMLTDRSISNEQALDELKRIRAMIEGKLGTGGIRIISRKKKEG